MKSSVVVRSLSHHFLIILLLALFSCTNARTISPNQASCLPVVVDSISNNLRHDGSYYVVNSLSVLGGGVSRGANNQLIQYPDEAAFGTPVVFKPMKPTTEEEITESIPLNIVFDTGDNSGTVWKVEGFPGPSPNFLSSNGVEGDQSDVSTWFQLKRVNYFSYTLVFCPTGDDAECSDVAVQEVDGEKRLFLAPRGTSFPFIFPVLFLKVKDGPIPQVAMDSYHFDLRFDRKYFVVNSLSTDGGGTSRSGPSNELVLSADATDFGMSIVFKPKPGSQKVELITESTPLNIVFNTGSYRNDGTVWKVEGFPGTFGPYFLSSNGVEGNTNDVSTWFQIEKASYFSFKLVFCPYKNDVTNCVNVGLQTVEGGQKRLVLTTGKSNFPLVFVPDESSIGKSSM